MSFDANDQMQMQTTFTFQSLSSKIELWSNILIPLDKFATSMVCYDFQLNLFFINRQTYVEMIYIKHFNMFFNDINY